MSLSHPTVGEMFAASLSAFWSMAERFELTMTEQSALLGVSERTCRRWRRNPPRMTVVALNRLQVILLAYERLSELAPVADRERALIFRARGSAGDPNDQTLSLLAALSTSSVSEMQAHYRRLEALAHSS